MSDESFLHQLKRQIRQNRVTNSIIMAIGIMFLVLAVLGAFLPFVPGILFLIIGLIILGEEFVLTRWIIKKSPRKVQDHFERRKVKKEGKNNTRTK